MRLESFLDWKRLNEDIPLSPDDIAFDSPYKKTITSSIKDKDVAKGVNELTFKLNQALIDIDSKDIKWTIVNKSGKTTIYGIDLPESIGIIISEIKSFASENPSANSFLTKVIALDNIQIPVERGLNLISKLNVFPDIVSNVPETGNKIIISLIQSINYISIPEISENPVVNLLLGDDELLVAHAYTGWTLFLDKEYYGKNQYDLIDILKKLLNIHDWSEAVNLLSGTMDPDTQLLALDKDLVYVLKKMAEEGNKEAERLVLLHMGGKLLLNEPAFGGYKSLQTIGQGQAFVPDTENITMSNEEIANTLYKLAIDTNLEAKDLIIRPKRAGTKSDMRYEFTFTGRYGKAILNLNKLQASGKVDEVKSILKNAAGGKNVDKAYFKNISQLVKDNYVIFEEKSEPISFPDLAYIYSYSIGALMKDKLEPEIVKALPGLYPAGGLFYYTKSNRVEDPSQNIGLILREYLSEYRIQAGSSADPIIFYLDPKKAKVSTEGSVKEATRLMNKLEQMFLKLTSFTLDDALSNPDILHRVKIESKPAIGTHTLQVLEGMRKYIGDNEEANWNAKLDCLQNYLEA